MTPKKIKCELRKRGYTMSDIAREFGTTPGAVRNSIHGFPFISDRIRKRIANVIGKEKSAIWPKIENNANVSS